MSARAILPAFSLACWGLILCLDLSRDFGGPGGTALTIPLVMTLVSLGLLVLSGLNRAVIAVQVVAVLLLLTVPLHLPVFGGP